MATRQARLVMVGAGAHFSMWTARLLLGHPAVFPEPNPVLAFSVARYGPDDARASSCELTAKPFRALDVADAIVLDGHRRTRRWCLGSPLRFGTKGG